MRSECPAATRNAHGPSPRRPDIPEISSLRWFQWQSAAPTRLAYHTCAQESSDSDKTVEYTGLDGSVETETAQKEDVDQKKQEEEEEEEDEDEDAPTATRWVLPGYAKALLIGLIATTGGAFLLSHYEADKRPIVQIDAFPPPPVGIEVDLQWPLLTVMEDHDRDVSPHAEDLDHPEIVEILSSCGTTDE